MRHDRQPLLVMILAPIAASLVQFAISRTREYGADEGGAEISGDPLALASALRKLDQAAHQLPNYQAQANPATAHLFIVNPLAGEGADSLFSTHPSTSQPHRQASRTMARRRCAPGAPRIGAFFTTGPVGLTALPRLRPVQSDLGRLRLLPPQWPRPWTAATN